MLVVKLNIAKLLENFRIALSNCIFATNLYTYKKLTMFTIVTGCFHHRQIMVRKMTKESLLLAKEFHPQSLNQFWYDTSLLGLVSNMPNIVYSDICSL